MKAWTRWQDWASLVLGALLFISPWVLGFAAIGAGAVDTWLFGVLAVILALIALAFLSVATIAEWISLAVGVLVFLSPWVLGFAGHAAAAWTAWIIGILFVIANGWTLYETRGSRMGAPAA